MCPWYDALRRTQYYFCAISAKNALSDSKHKETSDKFKLKDSLQNNWYGLFKYVKVIKDKDWGTAT